MGTGTFATLIVRYIEPEGASGMGWMLRKSLLFQEWENRTRVEDEFVVREY